MKALIPFAMILALAACTQAPPPAADTREADAKNIRDVEAGMLKAWTAKDADTLATFYADNASVMNPNMPVLTGSAAIKAGAKDMLAGLLTINFGATKVEVSKASDFGYSQGTYSLTMTDPKTKKAVAENGKYVTVYQKQADGSWKAVADIYNADAPAAPAAAK